MSLFYITLIDKDESFALKWKGLFEECDGLRIINTYGSIESVMTSMEVNANPDLLLISADLLASDASMDFARMRSRFGGVAFFVIAECGPILLNSVVYALSQGALGVLPRNLTRNDFHATLHLALQGGMCFPSAVGQSVQQLLQRILSKQGELTRHLSGREYDVLICLVNMASDKEIASQLGIGVGTVRTHVHRLFKKLDVSSRGDAVDKYFAVASSKAGMPETTSVK